ncbi:MAG: CHAD domain-containing protein [Firmicutes bacterium]|nr:CHAD domain-containing protein [Bacillota bacterium]
MIIDSGGFRITNTWMDQSQGARQTEKAEKQFFLEGVSDIYQALPSSSSRSDDTGPVYPALSSKLFPALDAFEESIKQLGKNPTPEEVDRSNIRRLIRAFQPVVEAFSGSYKEEKLEKSMNRITRLAGKLGKYKDVSVIENETAAISPKGKLPFAVEQKLKKYKEKQADKFMEVYHDFRNEGMDKSLDFLSHPKPAKEESPGQIEASGEKKVKNHILSLLDETEKTSMNHRDPHAFHEDRKCVRELLYAMNSAQDVFGFEKKDVEAITDLVNTFGIAQDKFIAYEWLHENGFEKEAGKMLKLYEEHQETALAQATEFMRSGILNSVREKL